MCRLYVYTYILLLYTYFLGKHYLCTTSFVLNALLFVIMIDRIQAAIFTTLNKRPCIFLYCTTQCVYCCHFFLSFPVTLSLSFDDFRSSAEYRKTISINFEQPCSFFFFRIPLFSLKYADPIW